MILAGALLAGCGALLVGFVPPGHAGWRRAGRAVLVAGLALSAAGGLRLLAEAM